MESGAWGLQASCIEQLCEQLWYRLEVSRKVRGRCGGESAEFIGKLVVEKMAIHSPLRVRPLLQTAVNRDLLEWNPGTPLRFFFFFFFLNKKSE